MSAPSETELTFESPRGQVPALLVQPADARFIYVMAHGAGAGMHHSFLAAMAGELGARAIATLRYQFPYMEAGGRPPDPPRVLEGTVRAAIACAKDIAKGRPILAGGKSMGGRMTSQLCARDPQPAVRGLAFLGFPLHPPKAPSQKRAEHLSAVPLPMLFLQGTRDALAEMTLMRPVCERLGPRATLHVVEGADHSFAVLKRSGRTGQEVMAELAEALLKWAEDVI